MKRLVGFVLALSLVVKLASAQTYFHGDDALYHMTQRMLEVCGAAEAGLREGETELAQGRQQIAPMSRFLDYGSCSSRPAGEGYVQALDAIVVVSDNTEDTDCDTLRHQGLMQVRAAANGNSTLECPNCVDGPDGDGVANYYQFREWQQVLRIIYAGRHAVLNKDPCDIGVTRPPTFETQQCNSDVRFELVNTWANMFQGPCTDNECTQLRHAFRPDDVSGTAQMFAALLSLAPMFAVQPWDVIAKPYCNGSELEDKDPIRRPCDGNGQSTKGENVCGRTNFSKETGSANASSSASTSWGPVAGTNAPTVAGVGDLGLVLPILVPSNLDHQYSNNNPCAVNGFGGKFKPAPMTLSTLPTAQQLCPNGVARAFNSCLWPVDANEHFGCINSSANRPVGAAGFANVMDGRVYNLTPRLSDGAIPTVVRKSGLSVTSRSLLNAGFYRIHQRTLESNASGAPCTEATATEQIGCLVHASPCSIGFAARPADIHDAGNKALNLHSPLSDEEGGSVVPPTTANVRRLLQDCATGDLDLRYPLSRKIYLNTLVGFNQVSNTPLPGGSLTGEAAMASCWSDRRAVDSAASFAGFITLDDNCGPNAPAAQCDLRDGNPAYERERCAAACAGGPVVEISNNGKDDDCDGVTDELTTESCSDGHDNDNDGLRDCLDTASCGADPACRGDQGRPCVGDFACNKGLVCEPRGAGEANICLQTQCTNGIKDPNETKADCGGVCPACTTAACVDACRAGEPTLPAAQAVLRFSTGTFLRPGTATYEQEDGRVVMAREHELRWVTRHGVRMALFEGPGKNLLARSSQWEVNPPWLPQAWPQLGVWANQAEAPDLTHTADLVEFTNGSGRGPMQTATVATTGATFSMFAASVPSSTAEAGPRARVFALGAGNSVLGSGSFWLEEGYQRFDLPLTMTANTSASILLSHIGGWPTADTAAEPSADYFVWGAQLEERAFPSSYIPTTTTSATRSADVLTFTPAQIPSWMGTGHFQISVAPLYGSAEMPDDLGYGLLTFVGNGFGELPHRYSLVMLARVGGQSRLLVSTGGALAQDRPLTWERGAVLTVSFDSAGDKIDVRGADTGNGSVDAPGLSFPTDGGLRIGGGWRPNDGLNNLPDYEAFAAISEPRQVASATATCVVDPACKCGNGVVDTGESCDMGRDALCNDTCTGKRDVVTGQSDGDCPNGQVLGIDIGARFGLASTEDVCWPAFCATNPGSSCGTTESPCGECVCTPNCAGKQCGDTSGNGCGGQCDELCGVLDIGCRRDADCGLGFVCGIGVGARMGKPAGTNICWPSECADYMPGRLACGNPTSKCGYCPEPPNECGERVCGKDRWNHACGTCAASLTCNADGECVSPISSNAPSNPETATAIRPVEPSTAGSLPGSFAVSNSGTATYHIPIDVPPGRGGVQPSLSIDYDSSDRDGYIGRGWSLRGLSAITRCPKTYAQNGLAMGIQLTSGDAFCMDGRQLFSVAGGYGQDGSEYRTELDSFVRVRSVGVPFAGNGSIYTGPTSFKAWTKDGRVLTFGSRAQSRVDVKIRNNPLYNSSNPVHFSWLLERVEDHHGNVMRVTYEQFAMRASDDFSFGGEIRPTAISYGASGSHVVKLEYSPVNWGSSARSFSGGVSRHFSSPLTTITTSVNQQVVRSYVMESETYGHAWRLNNIKVCTPNGASNVCLTPTTFSYLEGADALTKVATTTDWLGHIDLAVKTQWGRDYPQLSNLSSFRTTVVDATGDGRDDLFHEVLGDVYQPGPTVAVFTPLYSQFRASRGSISASKSGLHRSPRTWSTPEGVGDSDNDAVPNLLIGRNGVYDPDEDIEGDEQRWSRAYAMLGAPSAVNKVIYFDGLRVWLADVDGDGQDDAITCDEEGGGREGTNISGWSYAFGSVVACASNGGCVMKRIPNNVLRPDESCNVMFMDYDGDGTRNLLAFDPETDHLIALHFELNRQPFSKDLGRSPFGTDQANLRILDANGDGLSDVMTFDRDAGLHGELKLFFNTGRGFVEDEFGYGLGAGEGNMFRQSFVMDQNGDGRDELFLAVEASSEWALIRPAAAWSGSWQRTRSTLPYEKRKKTVRRGYFKEQTRTAPDWQKPTALDWDGDGVQDVILRAGRTTDPVAEIWRGGSRTRGLLKTVTQGSGVRVDVTYANGVDNPAYIRGTLACDYPAQCLPKLPHPVVATHTLSGDNGSFQSSAPRTEHHFEYRYEDARRDRRGRGWLGFSKVTAREVVSPGRVIGESITSYDLSTNDTQLRMFPGAGHPQQVIQRAYSTLSDGTQVTHETRRDLTWQLKTSGSGRRWLALTKETTSYSENNLPVSDVSKTYAYDGYGNVTSATNLWGDGRFSDVTTTYVNASSGFSNWTALNEKWLVGLPETVVVTGITNATVNPALFETKTVQFASTYDPLGKLKTVSRNIGSVVEEKTTLDYDGFGNVKVIWRSGRGRERFNSWLYLNYDSAGLYPISQESGMHRLRRLAPIETGFDLRTGQMQWRKESDGSWRTWNHDAFGRLGSSYGSDGNNSKVSYGAGTLSGAHFSVAQSGSNQPDMVTEYNAFGQPMYQRRWDFGNVSAVREWGYDALGRLMIESSPHLQSDPVAGVHQYGYDDLNRLIRERHPVVLPNGTVDMPLETHDYMSRGTSTGTLGSALDWAQIPGSQSAVVHTDPTAARTVQVLGMRGQTVATIDPGRNRTLFTYGAFDHLKKRAFLNVETTFATDERGQVTRMVDPISGVHEYKRDGFGLMMEYRHNSALTTYDYDGLGRLFHSTTPDGVYDWVWDGDGTDPTQAQHLVSESVASATIGNSTTSYDYHGPGGALTGIHRVIEGETFDTLIEHDIVTVIGQPPLPIARPKYVRFPVKNAQNQPVLEVAEYTYDKFGRVTTVWGGSSPAKKYWELAKTDAYGNDAEVYIIGGTNPIGSRKTVEPATGRLASTETLNARGQPFQREVYQYDSRGLLALKAETSLSRVETFQHDAFGRLDSRTFNGATFEYDYDAYGNLTRKPEVGALHYTAGKPYQLATTDSGSSFEYDPAGNGTQTLRRGSDVAGGRQELAYTAFDLPKSVLNGPTGNPNAVTSQLTTYRYDASNKRTVEQVQNGARTLYAGDAYRRVTQTNNSREQIVGIPTPSGTAIEVSIDHAGARTVRALHTDHLGSTIGVTNPEGAPTQSSSYDPFGKQSSTGIPNSVRASFTGHELDAGNRLINMRGRMYDPLIGRFTTPDPIVQSPGNSQSWNRYSYVMNSPLNFVDPTGFYTTGEWTGPDELTVTWHPDVPDFRIYEPRSNHAPMPKFSRDSSPLAASVGMQINGGDGGSNPAGEADRFGGGGSSPSYSESVVNSLASAVSDSINNSALTILDEIKRQAAWGAAAVAAVATVGSLVSGVRALIVARGMNSSNALSGVERASTSLLESVGSRRSVQIAAEGSDELRYLNSIGAEANVGGANMDSILLRPDPSKAAVLEEFLHGTQHQLGIIARRGVAGAEWHVKDFMIRHSRMLGLGAEDVARLKTLRDMGL